MSRKTVSRNIAFDDVKQLYYVTFSHGVGPDGKMKKNTRTFHSYPSALDALRRFEYRRTEGRRIDNAITVGEWLLYWLDEIIRPNRAVTTAYAYSNIVKNHLVPHLGSIRLDELDAMTVQRYYSKMSAEGLSPNTVIKHHILLHTALELARRQKHVPENCVDLVTPPRLIPARHTFYSAAQLRELFALCEGESMEPAVKLAGYLGLRRSEICGLRWCNIDMDAHIIKICEARTEAGGVPVEKGTKTASSERQLCISGMPDLLALLERRRAEDAARRTFVGQGYNPRGYLLVNEAGEPYLPDAVSGWFTAFVRKNGLPPLTLHGLRHSFASIANERRVPIYDISRTLGHSSTAVTTKVYTHLFDETHTEVLTLVAEAITAPSATA